MIQGERGALLSRLATALVLVAIVAVLVWTPMLRPGLTLFIAALVAVGLSEYFGLVRARGIDAEAAGGIVAGTLVTLTGYWAQETIINAAFLAASLTLAALHLFRNKHTIAGLAASIFSVWYLGWIPAHFIAMHGLPGQGPGLAMAMLVAVIFADSGAYFAGKALGRHKLAPVISPNKTWEGAIGGLLAAAAGMLALYALRGMGWHALPAWSAAGYVIIGLALGVVSQVGDLMESMLKRDAGLKDSGRLFPGHGGVLDRCDGLLFAAPVLYYWAVWAVRL